jgi:H/ACA ribonucleoprotein complex subunit 4
MERGVEHLKKIWIKDSAIGALCHGANLNAPGILRLEKGIERNELVAIFSQKNELVAIAKAMKTSDEMGKLKKGVVGSLERVTMDAETYPRAWKSE